MAETPYRVAVVVGSARPGSLNQSLAHALARLGGPEFIFDFVKINDLPLFDQEMLDAGIPPQVERVRAQIADADGVLFITPEHNRSVTVMLKNVIDWLSRPPAASVWAGRPAAIAGASYGRLGTVAAQQHLRAILGCLDMPTMGKPEVFIHLTPGLVSPEGEITDPDIRTLLAGFMEKFGRWVRRHAAAEPTTASRPFASQQVHS